jgi:hypothetical protein
LGFVGQAVKILGTDPATLASGRLAVANREALL